MKYKYLTDNELFQRVANDDAAAYEILYNRYWESLFLYAYKCLRLNAPAKDAVQDVFIGLWKRRGSLELSGSLRSYLFAAVRYEVLSNIAEPALTPLHDAQATMHLSAPADTTDRLHEKELKQLLATAVERLPFKMKQVYTLSRHQHKTISEIARELSLSEQTVKNQLSKALARLRAELREATLILALVPGIIFFFNN
ncbi:RNA polymerase sigma factor [Chitinophaga sp. sic0106]|uniref:RNA polymerase sigma factor n=1 Tax=Chitinophaga sp. sic0106 TaxID=2854785 RepID=UPI001C47D4CB|nr:sigma-70 family RNA polymerase sigma factor [Chitinophaga sp. sic0106]MBV7532104.1 sigma-70 family RNA polymerase sigma factor [Chitinophaga sp. sic0106]